MIAEDGAAGMLGPPCRCRLGSGPGRTGVHTRGLVLATERTYNRARAAGISRQPFPTGSGQAVRLRRDHFETDVVLCVTRTTSRSSASREEARHLRRCAVTFSRAGGVRTQLHGSRIGRRASVFGGANLRTPPAGRAPVPSALASSQAVRRDAESCAQGRGTGVADQLMAAARPSGILRTFKQNQALKYSMVPTVAASTVGLAAVANSSCLRPLVATSKFIGLVECGRAAPRGRRLQELPC